MTLWFMASLIKKRNDLADIAWGLGFVLLAWISFWLSGSSGTRSILSDSLVSVWGLRLAWHIYTRHRGKPEDFRYMAWRHEWGKWFYIRSYLQVYLLQGALLFLVALPLLIINRGPGVSVDFLSCVGVACGFLGSSSNRSQTPSLRGLQEIPKIAARYCELGCGAIRDIRTISVRLCNGGASGSWRSAFRAGGLASSALLLLLYLS